MLGYIWRLGTVQRITHILVMVCKLIWNKMRLICIILYRRMSSYLMDKVILLRNLLLSDVLVDHVSICYNIIRRYCRRIKIIILGTWLHIHNASGWYYRLIINYWIRCVKISILNIMLRWKWILCKYQFEIIIIYLCRKRNRL